ncbi:MAG: type II toxin-antitoxin system RelE/ParE family toxin [Bacteroidales bacterium]|nr:type II toxin-antitoxin system RelE/ParE family toxin [Bacteroidales bacterium]
MKVEVTTRAVKDTEAFPQNVHELIVRQVSRLMSANSLGDLDNVSRIKGSDEPYYRLKIKKYRLIIYYDKETDTVYIRRVKHRKDAYKKHNLPW